MQDNFNMYEWRLNQAIQETEKIKGKDGKGCWKGYRYAGTENGKDKCVPIKENEGQCPECGCQMEGTTCNECGYLTEDKFYSRDYVSKKYGDKTKEIEDNIHDEEDNNPNIWDLYTSLETPEETDDFVKGYMSETTFTDKHDDSPKLKGGQKDLPDELQAKILNKTETTNPKYDIKHTSLGRHIINPDQETYDLLKNKGSGDVLVKKLIANMLGNPNEKIYGANALPDGSILVMENDTINELKSNKYIKFENDEYAGPEPYLDEKLIEDYLLSIVDPSRVNDIKKFMSDDRNGWGKALDKFDLDDDNADSITEKQVEEFATEMASWYLESAADEFPYKNKGEMNETSNPEGDQLVLRFLKGIAKKYNYPVGQAVMFVKERLKSLGY